jgi:hypothetical protein
VRSPCLIISGLLISIFLAACATSPSPEQKPPDPTTEPWYSKAVDELTAMGRQASDDFHHGKEDAAAALIENGEKASTRLLSVPHPTLAAAEAVSDIDTLYGQMLYSNKNYGWARLLFQRNVARWKNWTPQTPETAARLKEAEASIAACDRHIDQ